MRRSTSLLLAPLVLTAMFSGACLSSTPEPSGNAPPQASVARAEVLLAGSRVQLIRLKAGDTGADAAPQAGQALRWEVHQTGGKLVASGVTADPRRLRAEFDQTLAHNDNSGDDIQGAVGTLSLHIPRIGGDLRIFEQSGAAWGEIGRVTLPQPTTGAVGSSEDQLLDPSKDIIGDPVEVVAHGDAAQRANILVVSEGYTEAEFDKYHADVDTMVKKLESVAGYQQYWEGFNIWRQDVRSTESGIADPAKGTLPNTAFNVSWGDDSSRPRRCVMYGSDVEPNVLAAVHSISSKVSADAIVFLVNDVEYGGCAQPWNSTVVMTRNDASPLILAHELGHSLFKLADEYGGSPSCNFNVSAPNISVNASTVPWSDLVNTSELPTAPGASANTVGAFDGASYCDHGIYRPQERCLMRTLDANLCQVCAREMVRFFDKRGFHPGGGSTDPGVGTGPGTGGALTLTNQTGTGLFARCPNTVGADCSDWTWIDAGAAQSIKTNATGNSFYIDNSTVGTVPVSFNWQLVTPPAGQAKLSIYANSADPLSPL